MRNEKSAARVEALIASSLALVALTVLTVSNPSTSNLFPPCVFRAITGWLCPGCGSARAIHAMMHGQLEMAFVANPLAVATVPSLPLVVFRSLLMRKPVIPATLPAGYLWAVVLAVLAFAIARNVPN
jgi:hypothetical protein